VRLAEKKVMVPNLNEKQANLRFQLFDWLKSQNLSAEEAIALLDFTAHEINNAALSEEL
jgi:hypothetical protein